MITPRTMALVPLCIVALAPLVSAAQADEGAARVLVYSGTQGDRPDGADRGNDALSQLAEETGEFTIDVTDDAAAMTIETLANYDVVLWNNPSGSGAAAPFSSEQRDQIVAWTQCGGGFVGIGQALAAWSDWDSWDELVGVVAESSSASKAKVTVLADSPITAPFGPKGASFSLAERFYAAATGQGPQDLSSDVTQLLATSAQSAAAWTSTFRGNNRSFVTSLGHNAPTWDLPAFRTHVVEGIAHAAAVRPDEDCVAAIGGSTATLPVGAAMVVFSPVASSSTNPIRYAPDTIVLSAGSSIEFVNLDTVTHTITDATGARRFDTGFVNLGATATVAGLESLAPGTYDFICQLHPVMTGTITIV
ncbi:MAG: plastocyanin [Glaciecola sp.]|jgi:plastocyanin